MKAHDLHSRRRATLMARNRRIGDLLADWEPQLRKAFLTSVSGIADVAQIGAISRMIENGDVDGALRAVGIEPARFRALDKTIADTFEAGGEFAAAGFPTKRTQGGILSLVFDIRNPRAETWLRDRSGTLIRDIVEDQRVMVRQHLTAGMEAGLNPRTVALDLAGRIGASGRREGGAIGLTASQESWVRNFRRELETLDAAALERRMRDKRFDRTIAAAIRDGRPLPADKIDTIVRNYRNRALKMRADGIARTEAIRALNKSQDEATRQAIESGQINAVDVTKIWVATKDNRVRDAHRAMDGQEASLDGYFVAPNGERLSYPGDPNASPAMTVNCRCFLTYKIDFMRGLK